MCWGALLPFGLCLGLLMGDGEEGLGGRGDGAVMERGVSGAERWLLRLGPNENAGGWSSLWSAADASEGKGQGPRGESRGAGVDGPMECGGRGAVLVDFSFLGLGLGLSLGSGAVDVDDWRARAPASCGEDTSHSSAKGRGSEWMRRWPRRVREQKRVA